MSRKCKELLVNVSCTGVTGPTGATGPTIDPNFAAFFAVMPGDNALPIVPGAAISFPQNGEAVGSITRLNPFTFVLPELGVYEVLYQVSVTEPGQLIVALDFGAGFVEQSTTVVGRPTGGTQIVGLLFVRATSPNTLLQIRNPTGNVGSLTLTTFAGGNQPVSARITIKQIL